MSKITHLHIQEMLEVGRKSYAQKVRCLNLISLHLVVISASSIQLRSEDIAEIRKRERGMRAINPAIYPQWDD